MKKIKLKILLVTALLAVSTAIPASAQNERKQILLVNKKNVISEDFVPEPLIDIVPFVSASKNEIYLQKEAALQYIEMVEEMKTQGISLTAVSGYRTYQYQSVLYINKANYYKQYYSEKEAFEKAGRVVAPPGASEHQTGLAIDVSVSSIDYALDSRFQDTKAYKWLKENCHQYGFIIRYPQDKKEITDIIFEPWHLRYVGAPYAEEIYIDDVCLEEYLENTTYLAH